MNINENMSLAEIVKNYPQTIGRLNELHLDYCCNGKRILKDVISEKEMNLADILADLEKASHEPIIVSDHKARSVEDFEKLSIDEMIRDVMDTHHVIERELMREVEDLLNKILIVHYEHHKDQLVPVHKVYSQLKAELEEHFAREEKEVFPRVLGNPHPDKETKALVQELIDEHSAAGDLIKELEKLTNHFNPPADACMTYGRTFKTMERLVQDIFIHIFKENSVLFPEIIER